MICSNGLNYNFYGIKLAYHFLSLIISLIAWRDFVMVKDWPEAMSGWMKKQ